MKKVIVITGTPGTGKTYFAKKLAEKLGAKLISANSLVNKKKFFSSYSSDGTKIVVMNALKKEIEKHVKLSKEAYIVIEGHLLCDMAISNATAIVLREHLNTLKRRLIKRGYGTDKVRDNLVAEATDYCGINAETNYKHVFEVLSSNKDAFKKILKIATGKKVKSNSIDLLEELNGIIKSDIKFAI